MGDPQKALQVLAAKPAQQLLDVLAVLGRLPPLQEGGEGAAAAVRGQADGAKLRQPLSGADLRLFKLIFPAEERQDGRVLIHQQILCLFHSGRLLSVSFLTLYPMSWVFSIAIWQSTRRSRRRYPPTAPFSFPGDVAGRFP